VTVDGRFELHQAIVDNQLVLYYQPIVGASDRKVVSVEALVRWRHPTRGILPPSQFVPAIEQSGLARELTLWVVREAALQAAVWKKDGESLPVGVNLSPENLRDPHFRRFLEITLRAAGSPDLLIAEIPAATLTSADQKESLAMLRGKGIRVCIDDVVAPVELSDVPADGLKIGRALVARLGIDSRALDEATQIVRAARALGRSVTAVGIEDEPSWKRAVALGCDAVQGFSVAEPLSTADLDAWRRRTQR
jgi:EAL domain-containing protein (putative c-di-GMP-specific phosphodiesterase class I)